MNYKPFYLYLLYHNDCYHKIQKYHFIVSNDKYKIQYEVRGLDDNEIQSILLKNIKLVININLLL